MTQTQKILAKAAHLQEVHAGQFIEVGLDLIMGNDITSPVAIGAFEQAGFTQVFDPERIVFVLDHSTPCKDIATARLCQITRQFAKVHRISHIFDTGTAGIEHALLPEQGFIAPGECIIGADSHTCTYGALGAFSTGVGSTDMAAAMASGTCWLRVPEAILVRLHGKLPYDVSGKDLILSLIGTLGVEGARYQSLEFCGDGLLSLSMDDRFTIANMTIEAGAKNAYFPVDAITRAYLQDRVRRSFTVFDPDADAVYTRTLDIDLSLLEPTVALPHSPGNTHRVQDVAGIKVDQVVIGSCTNGRLSDLRIAARIFKHHQVAEGVRCIVIPATQEIALACVQEGLVEIFLRAGCAFSTPTCGPCLGGHMGCLAAGETCVSTTNRNFIGRMGDQNSQVILASPAVAAASAVCGTLTMPGAYLQEEVNR